MSLFELSKLVLTLRLIYFVLKQKFVQSLNYLFFLKFRFFERVILDVSFSVCVALTCDLTQIYKTWRIHSMGLRCFYYFQWVLLINCHLENIDSLWPVFLYLPVLLEGCDLLCLMLKYILFLIWYLKHRNFLFINRLV